MGGEVGKEVTISLPNSFEAENAECSTEWANITRHIRTVARRLQELDHHCIEDETTPSNIDNALWSMEKAQCNVVHVDDSDGLSSNVAASPQAFRINLARK